MEEPVKRDEEINTNRSREFAGKTAKERRRDSNVAESSHLKTNLYKFADHVLQESVERIKEINANSSRGRGLKTEPFDSHCIKSSLLARKKRKILRKLARASEAKRISFEETNAKSSTNSLETNKEQTFDSDFLRW